MNLQQKLECRDAVGKWTHPYPEQAFRGCEPPLPVECPGLPDNDIGVLDLLQSCRKWCMDTCEMQSCLLHRAGPGRPPRSPSRMWCHPPRQRAWRTLPPPRHASPRSPASTIYPRSWLQDKPPVTRGSQPIIGRAQGVGARGGRANGRQRGRLSAPTALVVFKKGNYVGDWP